MEIPELEIRKELPFSSLKTPYTEKWLNLLRAFSVPSRISVYQFWEFYGNKWREGQNRNPSCTAIQSLFGNDPLLSRFYNKRVIRHAI